MYFQIVKLFVQAFTKLLRLRLFQKFNSCKSETSPLSVDISNGPNLFSWGKVWIFYLILLNTVLLFTSIKLVTSTLCLFSSYTRGIKYSSAYQFVTVVGHTESILHSLQGYTQSNFYYLITIMKYKNSQTKACELTP